MSVTLEHTQAARQRLSERGRVRTIREGDTEDDTTLREGEEVTIYSTQVPADKVYAWGAGNNWRDRGRSAFMYFKAHATGAGSGTADEAITGDLVAVITDSEQRDVHARYELGDLTTLADAQSDNRTDRPMQPVVVPIAREDQHLELRIIADSNADGYVYDDGVDNSTDARVFFTDIPA